jgi:hypothetical protein
MRILHRSNEDKTISHDRIGRAKQLSLWLADHGGTFEKSRLSLSVIVGAQKRHWRASNKKGLPTLLFCTAAITWPASAPTIMKPRMLIVVLADKSFHESLPLLSHLCAARSVHGRLSDVCNDPLLFCLAFTQPYVGKPVILEHAACNQPISCAASPSCQIVTKDSKIVFGYVRSASKSNLNPLFTKDPPEPRHV